MDGFKAELRGGGGKVVVITFVGKGDGLRRITITVTAEDVRQFWRCEAGRGGEGFLKALSEHLESAVGSGQGGGVGEGCDRRTCAGIPTVGGDGFLTGVSTVGGDGFSTVGGDGFSTGASTVGGNGFSIVGGDGFSTGVSTRKLCKLVVAMI